MKIALCAPFLEADILARRIAQANPQFSLQVDEYWNRTALLAFPSLCGYDVIWIAWPGAAGLEAVTQLRAKSKRLPVVWQSNDWDFLLAAYHLTVDYFLDFDSGEDELNTALCRCAERNTA